MLRYKIITIWIWIALVLVLLAPPCSASEGNEGSSSQGIIDGIVNGLSEAINRLFLEFPGLLWNFFFESLLLAPLGLDDTGNDDDIISSTGFFLIQQPDIEPFRGAIEGLSELLVLFLALGVIAVAVKAAWEILMSDSHDTIEAVVKRDVLPLFLGAFALSLSVEIYQIVLYVARLAVLLFMAPVDYLVFRNLALFLVTPDLFGLLGIALIFLFALFLLFTYVLELVNAFLLPIFITFRALPFDVTKAIGQAGLNFSVINAFMPALSAMVVFIAVSIWSSATFWESLALEGYALILTKRFLGMMFLLLAMAIPVGFYFTALIVPVLRYAISIKTLKEVNRNEKANASSVNAADGAVRAHPAYHELRGHYKRDY